MKSLVTQKFYSNVYSILDVARSSIAKAVNFEIVKAYWEVGKNIVEEEQK